MPIYTYQCDSCGVRFERQQSFNDPPLTRCPECHKKTLRKIYTPVGIVFKGSGFYSTDHRSPSGGGRAGTKSSDAEKRSDTKVEKETKKESTTEAKNKSTPTTSE